ncbi:unnamed protein product, partial [Amoebophrya sp. A120]
RRLCFPIILSKSGPTSYQLHQHDHRSGSTTTSGGSSATGSIVYNPHQQYSP